MVAVTSVRCLEGFAVELGFSDGTSRRVDLAPHLAGPAFAPHRRDPAFFRTVRVDPRAGTIVWPDGTDLDPDVLRWGRRADGTLDAPSAPRD